MWVSQLFSRCAEAPPGTDDIKQSAFLGGTGKAARERGLVVVVPETRLELMSMQVRLSAATTNSDSGRLLPPSPGIHRQGKGLFFNIFNEQYTDKKENFPQGN